MSNYTPDSWIERNWLDDGPPMTDEQLCEEGLCDHAHCAECGAIMPPEYLAQFAECCADICDICWWARMAQLQLCDKKGN